MLGRTNLEGDWGMGPIELALAGNPNTGKTCIFNNLTGARQNVGNWPGVTVEKKEGTIPFQGRSVKLVDLPGAYSLSSFSEDEAVARQYLVNNSANAVINVVDSCNLRRNLYLTLQMMEAGANVVIALNMMDEACRSCINIDVEKLAALFGVPVIPTVAAKGQGMQEVVQAAVDRATGPRRPFKIEYGPALEKPLAELEKSIRSTAGLDKKYPSNRWLALKVLEEDEGVIEEVKEVAGGRAILARAERARAALAQKGVKADSALIAKRYEYIDSLVAQCASEACSTGNVLSDKIDKVATHRLFGIPVFFVVMWLLFEFTFRLSGPFITLVEDGFSRLGAWLAIALPGMNASGLFTSFVVDGLVAGLGTVMGIVPVLVTLFLGITLLEDSGYMARIAYIMDKPMRVMGLNGKAFIPFLLGFGCNVPAIMSTRTLESKRDRLLAIIANPFISCTARLPVYILFASAFFPAQKMPVVMSLYFIGLALAIITVKVFSKVVPEEKDEVFLIELPPYRLPALKGVVTSLWEKISDFLKRVSTVILAAVIAVWALSSLPYGVEYASRESLAGQVSSFIAPIFTWAGFANWRATVALIFGVLAKEVVVSTLGVVYKAGEGGLGAALAADFTPLSAFSFMTMTLLYAPCIATIATIRSETKSWKWTLIALVYGFGVAWLLSVLVYQVGSIFS